jgi:aryl-alcohol dehydrogenase-like predicted oxidoreductase
VLDQPGVDVALWGARRPEQVEAAEGIFGWSLDADALETIDRIVAATVKHPVGPDLLAPPPRGGA